MTDGSAGEGGAPRPKAGTDAAGVEPSTSPALPWNQEEELGAAPTSYLRNIWLLVVIIVVVLLAWGAYRFAGSRTVQAPPPQDASPSAGSPAG